MIKIRTPKKANQIESSPATASRQRPVSPSAHRISACRRSKCTDSHHRRPFSTHFPLRSAPLSPMASWLKVAEDLFEVVDRRAKLVATELADEQPGSQASGAPHDHKVSNAEEVYSKRKKSKDKGQAKSSSIEKSIRSSIEKSLHNRPSQDQKKKEKSVSSTESDNLKSLHSDPLIDAGASEKAETRQEPLSDNSKDPIVSNVQNGTDEEDNNVEVQLKENDIETSASSLTEDATTTNVKSEPEISSSPLLVDKEIESIKNVESSDANSDANLVKEEIPLATERVRWESEKTDSDNSATVTAADHERETSKPSPTKNKQKEHLSDSHMKVQDQLDEAQGLLKSAVKIGQSKEARLARICAGLSTRLQEYKAENKQLEELLVAERELTNSYEARIKQLQQDLSLSKMEVARVESNMSDALAAKNSEIEALVNSLDALKKEAAASEEKLASFQTDMDSIRRSRELTETRMIQALREELASVERRAEEERAAHNATKMAAVEREVELEHRAVESSNALARIQRAADESTSRAAELEHKLALLEVENASLTQELQDLEARNRRGQKKSSEEANQTLQMQAWQEEVERARQGQREAENKLSYIEAELQKMRVEMAGMKRDAEHYSRQEHMELEKRYRELTDLLYHKQTQLESMASEKAALEFQLVKEQKRVQEAQLEAERSRVTNRASASWEEDTDIKALEPLPLHHRHMVGACKQLQRAAKLLDSGAVRVTRFLWRYPTARVSLLCYLVFVHLFLMYLLHRLQEQADKFASKEVAASMGLNKLTLV
ncbi:golgin-84 [Canna indica]|uniref:Golgin-84 n=1 Tax=Canna indica TaxID=4628 RepID=A0AAQ3JZP6_9LILI|nr:golgin-84 [Canna indica]